MPKQKSFNWQGITENTDGSFFAEDAHAKRRLMKELHRQGHTIRSKKLPDGGYRVSVSGTRVMGPRPMVRSYPRRSYPRTRSVRYRRTPVYHARPAYRDRPMSIRRRTGPSGFQRLSGWVQRRHQDQMKKQAAEQKWRLERKEMNEKMKQDRIQAEEKQKEHERQETVRQLHKQELRREQMNEAQVQQAREQTITGE